MKSRLSDGTDLHNQMAVISGKVLEQPFLALHTRGRGRGLGLYLLYGSATLIRYVIHGRIGCVTCSEL